ncbi:MAG TPA: hypothetical protein VIL74_24705 [Pyrinomonadaceae bacterium]|jgi:hypothetical protein
MKSIFLVVILSLFVISNSAQEKQESVPVVQQISIPMYPVLAIHLGLQEGIKVSLKINREGKVVSTSFNRGDKNFHTVIKEALQQWSFEESSENERNVDFTFIFTLVPADSKSFITSVIKLPNTIEVFAKRVKIINTIDR